MRWYQICGLTLLFLLTLHSAHAYERDVHYDLTKYLARWAAFSETEADQVAVADQELDAKPEFNPLPNLPLFCPQLSQLAVAAPTPAVIQAACKNDPEFQRMLTAQRAFHFVDGARLQALRDSAFRGKNLKTLGHYLHALQDTFAHSLMDYQELPPIDKLVANLGFLPDEKIIGHLMYGHSVDKTYERPDLAEFMARYVYTELTHFQGSTNRWTEVEASIARFARERDAQKKLSYLSASLPSQPAQSSAQRDSLTEPPQVQEPLYEGRAFAEWQGDLSNSSPEVRARAAQVLVHFGSQAVPVLTRNLKDAEAAVRWASAIARGQIGLAAKDAVPALTHALGDPEAMVRAGAEYALGRIDPEPPYEGRTFAEWQGDLRDPSPEVRKRAVQTLAHFGSRGVALLTQTLRDADANIRWAAAGALGQIGPTAKDAVPALVEALGDTEATVRAGAEYALGQIDPVALEQRERTAKRAADKAQPREGLTATPGRPRPLQKEQLVGKQPEETQRRGGAAGPLTQAVPGDVPEELVRKLEANGMSRAEAIKSLKALKQKYGRYCYNKDDFRKDWRQGGFVALWSATEPGGLVPECSEKEEEAKLAQAPRERVAASRADRATLISYLGLYPGLVKTFPAGSSRVLRTRKIAAFPDAVQDEMFIRQLDSGAPHPEIQLFTIEKDGALHWGAYSGPLLRQVISGESYHIQRPFRKPYYMLKLPVRPGTTWKDETPSARIESTILAVEDVTVRAGRFEACAKVKAIVTHNDPRNHNADFETVQWLCPEIGMVKSIRKDKSGTWGPPIELISVTRAPQW